MFMNGLSWKIYFLGIMHTAVVNISGKATLDIVQRTVLKGTNITCRCPFSFKVDQTKVKVYWWRNGNKTILSEDSRKVFIIKRGGAYRHLLNVNVLDVGTYHCEVRYENGTFEGGQKTKLLVYTPPAPPKIVSAPSESPCVSLRLQCRTAAFYPKEFSISWYKNGAEILNGFRNEQQPNIEGLYKLVSPLEDTQAVQSDTVYTCEVHHISNPDPARNNYTVVNQDAVDVSDKKAPHMVQKVVLSGLNVTCRCPFPFNLNLSNISVYWWRDGNKTFLKEDGRKLFSIKAGGAYLHLLNVTVADSGTYYCVAKQAGQTVGKGTGEQIIVHVAPSPVKIVSIPSGKPSPAFLRLQCRTAAFYPKEFSLTWHKNGTEVQSGITHEQNPTSEGLYEVISSLDETEPVKPGMVYTCRVHHISQLIPAIANYTVPKEAGLSAAGFGWIVRGTVAATLIQVWAVIIYFACKGNTKNDSRAAGQYGTSLRPGRELKHIPLD